MRQISAGMQRKPPSSTIERSREKNRFTEHGKQSTHKFREREITHRRSKSPAKRSKSPLKLSNKSQDRRSHITALARKEPKPVKVGRLPAPTNRRMMDESRDASDVSSDKRNFSRENGKAKSARKEPKPMQEAIECLALVKDGKMATRILTKRKKPHAPNLSEVRVQVSARQAHKNSIIPRITIFQRKAKTEPKKEIKKQVSTMSKRESSTSKKKIKKHHQKSNILMNSLSIIAEEPSVEHDLPETLAPPTSDQKEENGGFSLTRPFTFRERKTEFKDPDTKKINVLSEDVGGTTEPVLRKVGPIFFTETNLSRVKSNKKKEKVKADSLQMKKTYSRLSPAQLPKEEEVPPPEDTPSYMRQDPPDDKSEHVPMQPKKAKQTTQNEHEQEWSLIDWLWEPQKSEPASTLRDAEASSVETTTQQSEEQETAVNSNDPKPTRAKLEEQIPKHAQLTTQPTQKQEISLEKPTEPAGVVAGDKQKPTEIKQTERVVKGTSLELLKGQEAEQSSTVTKRSTKTKNKKQSSKKKPTKGFLTPNCAAQGISLAMSTLKEPEIRGQRATTDADLKRKAKTIKDIMAMVEKEKELNRSSSVICAPSRADDIDFDDLSFNFFAWGSVDTAYDDATEGAETRDGYDESTVDESTVGAPNVGESTVGESTFGETSVWETGIPGFNFFSFGSNATHVHETRDDHDVSIDDESSIDESSIEDESTVDNSNDGSESVEWSSSSEEEEDDGEEENWEVVSEFELPKMQKNEEEMSVFSVVSSAVSSLLSSKDREKLLEKESSSKDKIEEDIEISTERVKEAVSVFKQHANRLGIDRSDLFSAVKRTDATIVTL